MSIELRIGEKTITCDRRTFQPLVATPKRIAATEKLLIIWGRWQQVIRHDSANQIESVGLRGALNRAYDDFVQEYGPLVENQALLRFQKVQDPRLGLLLALETKDGEKAEIFYKRVHHPPPRLGEQIYFDADIRDRLSQAFPRVLSDCGSIEIDEIAAACGIAPETAEEELVQMGLVVREPLV
jgi:hypothetical protein